MSNNARSHTITFITLGWTDELVRLGNGGTNEKQIFYRPQFDSSHMLGIRKLLYEHPEQVFQTWAKHEL